MKTVNWKDVAIRAIKTFVEGVMAFATMELAGMDLFAMGKEMWAAVGVSAVAAGISAVWNGMIEPVLKPMLPDK